MSNERYGKTLPPDRTSRDDRGLPEDYDEEGFRQFARDMSSDPAYRGLSFLEVLDYAEDRYDRP